MTDFLLRFANEHPFLLFIGALFLLWAWLAPFSYLFRAYNRTLRSRNIVAQGWPKAPIDADGDVVYPDKEEKY